MAPLVLLVSIALCVCSVGSRALDQHAFVVPHVNEHSALNYADLSSPKSNLGAETQPKLTAVLLVNSDKNNLVPRTIAQLLRFGYDYTVAGWGQSWDGPLTKLRYLRQQLESWRDTGPSSFESKLVLVLDAYDCAVLRGPEAIVEGFNRANASMLFGSEPTLWPDLQLRTHWLAQRNITHLQYLNSGVFVAKASFILAMLIRFPVTQHAYLTDQHYWQRVALSMGPEAIKLDTTADIFLNMLGSTTDIVVRSTPPYVSNQRYQTFAAVLHGNGKDEGYHKDIYDGLLEIVRDGESARNFVELQQRASGSTWLPRHLRPYFNSSFGYSLFANGTFLYPAQAPLPYCGDERVQEPSGEQCDDGNTVSGDGCDSLCQLERGKPIHGIVVSTLRKWNSRVFRLQLPDGLLSHYGSIPTDALYPWSTYVLDNKQWEEAHQVPQSVSMIQNAYVDKCFVIRTAAGQVTETLSIEQPSHKYVCDPVFNPEEAKVIASSLAVAATRHGHVYFHWMTEVLPRLMKLKESLSGVSDLTYYVSDAGKWCRDVVRRLGIPLERVIWADAQNVATYYAQNVFYASHQSTFDMIVSKEAMQEVKRFLDTAYPPQTYSAGSRLVYLSRAGSQRRRVLNEKNLLQDLNQQLGKVEVIEMDANTQDLFSLATYINSASVLIGPHGSALTNMLFAKPGTHVVELVSSVRTNLCFYVLAEALGLKYHMVPVPATEWMTDFFYVPSTLVTSAVLAIEPTITPVGRCGAGYGVLSGTSSSVFPDFRPNATGSCGPCSPGYFSTAAMDTCQMCPRGMYAPGVGNAGCLLCPPNSFGDGSGRYYCSRCSWKTHSVYWGAPSPDSCTDLSTPRTSSKMLVYRNKLPDGFKSIVKHRAVIAADTYAPTCPTTAFAVTVIAQGNSTRVTGTATFIFPVNTVVQVAWESSKFVGITLSPVLSVTQSSLIDSITLTQSTAATIKFYAESTLITLCDSYVISLNAALPPDPGNPCLTISNSSAVVSTASSASSVTLAASYTSTVGGLTYMFQYTFAGSTVILAQASTASNLTVTLPITSSSTNVVFQVQATDARGAQSQSCFSTVSVTPITVAAAENVFNDTSLTIETKIAKDVVTLATDILSYTIITSSLNSYVDANQNTTQTSSRVDTWAVNLLNASLELIASDIQNLLSACNSVYQATSGDAISQSADNNVLTVVSKAKLRDITIALDHVRSALKIAASALRRLTKRNQQAAAQRHAQSAATTRTLTGQTVDPLISSVIKDGTSNLATRLDTVGSFISEGSSDSDGNLCMIAYAKRFLRTDVEAGGSISVSNDVNPQVQPLGTIVSWYPMPAGSLGNGTSIQMAFNYFLPNCNPASAVDDDIDGFALILQIFDENSNEIVLQNSTFFYYHAWLDRPTYNYSLTPRYCVGENVNATTDALIVKCPASATEASTCEYSSTDFYITTKLSNTTTSIPPSRGTCFAPNASPSPSPSPNNNNNNNNNNNGGGGTGTQNGTVLGGGASPSPSSTTVSSKGSSTDTGAIVGGVVGGVGGAVVLLLLVLAIWYFVSHHNKSGPDQYYHDWAKPGSPYLPPSPPMPGSIPPPVTPALYMPQAIANYPSYPDFGFAPQPGHPVAIYEPSTPVNAHVTPPSSPDHNPFPRV